ncbi:MAG TPA: PadR family transcriptional regulator [Candidatus Limnocylindrales bacterium]|nr:PadR family transcriptional regulator [Candidatus Limnocylindrales bacterium]
MSVRYGLLAILAEAPNHGYQLKTDFERRTAGSWQLNIGQIYTTLQRLERDGLVEPLTASDRHAATAAEPRGAEARTAGPRADERHAYRITAAGRAQLEAWLDQPVITEGPPRDELTIKVLLAVAAGDIEVTAILQRQRTASVEQLQAYTRRKAQADPERDLALLILLDALIFRTEAEVRWLDATEARIRQR